MKKFLDKKTFKGLYAVIPTPFDKRGHFSAHLFREILGVIKGSGVDGVILAGTHGECFSLENRERIPMTEIASEVLSPTRINLVVSGTALTLNDQIKLGRQLADAGAQALINLFPFISILSDDEYFEFWKRLAGEVGEIGLIMYHLAAIGRLPSVKSILKVVQEIPTVCGTKEGHTDFKRWLFLHKNTDIMITPANDYQWTDYFKAGSRGFMTPSPCLAPELTHKIYEGCVSRQWKETEPLQKTVMKIWDVIIKDKLLAGYGGISKYKAVCRALGWVDPGFCKPPLLDVPNEIQTKLNKKIKRYFSDWCNTNK